MHEFILTKTSCGNEKKKRELVGGAWYHEDIYEKENTLSNFFLKRYESYGDFSYPFETKNLNIY